MPVTLTERLDRVRERFMIIQGPRGFEETCDFLKALWHNRDVMGKLLAIASGEEIISFMERDNFPGDHHGVYDR